MPNRTALFSRHQPGGVFTIHDLPNHPGNVIFVSSVTGTDGAGYGDNPDAPVATVDYAIGLCTASKGDVIYVLPGHAETTTAIALDVAGVRIIGLGFGANRPTLTATTAASDLVAVTAANCELINMRLVGAASGVTALLDLSSAATDFRASKCEFVQAATPLSGLTISADRFVFEDCVFRGSADGPDRVFDLEAKCNDWRIERSRFLFGKNGLDNEIIRSANKSQIGYVVSDFIAVGLDTLVVNLASSSAGAPDGYITDGRVMYSAAITSIEDGVAAATSKGAAFGRVYAADVTGKASALIPLATAS
jgi:hypothetical protein